MAAQRGFHAGEQADRPVPVPAREQGLEALGPVGFPALVLRLHEAVCEQHESVAALDTHATLLLARSYSLDVAVTA